MKFSTAAILSISAVSANLDSLSSLLNEQVNHLKNLTSGGPLRSSGSTRGVSLTMDALQEYGCWCFFDDLHGMGKGEPQDGYDTACMHYHHGVECAKMEFLNEAANGECDPATVYGYVVKSMPDVVNPKNMIYDCETHNTDSCLKATCYLETYFVKLLLAEDLVEEKSPRYYDYKLNFDSDTCLNSKGAREHEKFCCGAYSANSRRPVNRYLDDGDKECCNASDGTFKTYDASMKQCCDGDVLLLGSC